LQIHEGGLLGTYEIRSETGNAGTGMYRRGADEHGCEFAPVAGSRYAFIEFLMSLTALSRILFIQAETGVFIFSQLFINLYLAYGKMLPNSN
jgi:hypothetical protein